jgi:ABC-type glycerol-3-phosphate transport system substrate-binding protein
MQQPGKGIPAVRRIRILAATVGVLVAGLVWAVLTPVGCSPPVVTPTGTQRPFDGVRVKVHCADKAFADAVTPITRVWSARTGAAVEVVFAPLAPDDGADVGVIPAAEIGTWADRGDLLPVPAAMRDQPTHPYQWQSVLPAYRGEQFAGWGNQLVALPLAGDGYVLVYRADRFADPAAGYLYPLVTDRDLAPPATWEDYSAVAALFAQFDGKAGQPRPSLPPLGDDPGRAADLFLRVAACYDRPAVGEAEVGIVQGGRDPLSFQFEISAGKPRLQTDGFKAAAGWLAGLKASGALPTGGPADPVAALVEGRAVMAVLSLAELARLPREGGRVPDRFGVAALPGTRQYADPTGKGGMVPTDVNYVPYFAGGRFGVVRKGCARPDAAFDLLSEIGGPARSLELLSTPGLGAGPFRTTHLDLLLLWLGYGFDEEGSKALDAALKKYVRPDVKNAVFGLRGPDHARLTVALGTEVNAIGNGTLKPDDGLARAAGTWERIVSEVPEPRRLDLLRRAAGRP